MLYFLQGKCARDYRQLACPGGHYRQVFQFFTLQFISAIALLRYFHTVGELIENKFVCLCLPFAIEHLANLYALCCVAGNTKPDWFRDGQFQCSGSGIRGFLIPGSGIQDG